MPIHSLNRSERLKSRKVITRLFESGHKLRSGPLLMLWMFPDENLAAPVQFGVSVSKRNFRRAVDRNRIKRQIREAYRKIKPDFIEGVSHFDQSCAIFVIYIGRGFPDSRTVDKAISGLCDKWKAKISAHHD